jgi:hypothetical protein
MEMKRTNVVVALLTAFAIGLPVAAVAQEKGAKKAETKKGMKPHRPMPHKIDRSKMKKVEKKAPEKK